MAIDLNNADGAKEIESELVQLVKNQMRQLAFEAYRAAIIFTPADTGRLRWGWYITINTPSSETPPAGKYQFPSLPNHSEVAEDNFSINDTLWICNNVPYIRYVNDGTSRQAPRRFVEQTLDHISNIAERVNQ